MADKILVDHARRQGDQMTQHGASHCARLGPQHLGDQLAIRSRPTRRSGFGAAAQRRRKRSIFERLDELKLPPLGRPLTQKDIDEADHGGDDRKGAAVPRDVMIGLDTNVLLRLGDDDEPASATARGHWSVPKARTAAS